MSTGIKVRVPHGTYGRIAPRSGLSLKGLDIAARVIDRDYSGEVKVILVNHADHDFAVSKGDRIAQLVLERIATADVEVVMSLNITI